MLKNTMRRTTATIIMATSLLGIGLATPTYAATNTITYSKTYTFTNVNDFNNWLQQFYKQYSFAHIQTPVQQPVSQPTTEPTPVQVPVQKPASQPVTAPTTQAPTADATVQPEIQQVLDLVNQERVKAGVAPLKLSNSLDKMASVKAADMRDKQYFDHTSPTYGSPFNMMTTFGISYSYAGENIAAGQKTPTDVMNSWMNSSGHRANILNPNYTELGVGLAKGGSYGTYWVQEFIRP
jgi:uncharacterized YkwD family protein